MQFYEINILISPSLSQEEAISFISNLENHFQDLGKIISDTKVERKKLAYPIKKEEEAWFSFFNFFPKEDKIVKETLDLIEKKLKEEKNILRHLTIKKDEKKVERKRRELKPLINQEQTTTSPKIEVELKDVEEKINELLEE
jgi:small subunit ribosomal protein S6